MIIQNDEGMEDDVLWWWVKRVRKKSYYGCAENAHQSNNHAHIAWNDDPNPRWHTRMRRILLPELHVIPRCSPTPVDLTLVIQFSVTDNVQTVIDGRTRHSSTAFFGFPVQLRRTVTRHS